MQSFQELVASRRSCRAYDPDRPVPTDAIRACLEAAQLAPSACNRQPWRFVVVTDAAQRRRIYERGRRPGIPHEWLQDVPVIIALCVDKSFLAHHLAPAISGIPYYLIDIGIAGEHLVLAATERGLGTCWIGWFNPRAIKRILNIPRSVQVAALITLGYPADGATPTPPRPRLELDAFVHQDNWDAALQHAAEKRS